MINTKQAKKNQQTNSISSELHVEFKKETKLNKKKVWRWNNHSHGDDSQD